jgi:hypothetical protein
MIVETKSSFANHLFLWWITATIFSFIFLPAIFLPKDFEVSQSEVAFFTGIGRDTGLVTASANHLYTIIFETTGLAKIFNELYLKADMGQAHQAGLSNGVQWARSWVDGFLSMAYRGIWRTLALWPVYIAGIISFCIPALIDGLVIRAKKKYDFLQSNPVFFYGAAHSVALCFGMGFFIPIIPVDIGILMIGGFFSIVALALWVAASNFQTGQ